MICCNKLLIFYCTFVALPDTVWSRNVTFINETDGRATYIGVSHGFCDGTDAIEFTEAITAGPSSTNSSQRAEITYSPYLQCKRGPDYPSDGLFVGYHHILFQRDVMDALHRVIKRAWNVTSVWDAANKCFQHSYCQGTRRIAEYPLYFAFLEKNYPERVRKVKTRNNIEVINSGVCNKQEMECCERKGVLLKGCHDHSRQMYLKHGVTGGVCCPNSVKQ